MMMSKTTRLIDDSPKTKHRKRAVMKDDYVGMACTICGAAADGMHYGAISCRSCNAFFRRAVGYKQTYECRNNGTCDVTVEVRCSCRACRFQKCVNSGMKISAVQPRRDPTGSQKERRKRQMDGSDEEDFSPEMDSPIDQNSPYGSRIKREKSEPENIIEFKFKYNECGPMNLGVTSYPITPEELNILKGKRTIEEILELQENQYKKEGIRYGVGGENFDTTHIENNGWTEPPDPLADDGFDSGADLERLTEIYKNHVEHMRLSMVSFPDFLAPKPFRPMVPDDVEGLSKAELSGLLFWVSRMQPYLKLSEADRTALLKRYSVRKLSLDHFYVASQHKDHIKHRNFCMLNNTYVPHGATGFELNTDDPQQIAAKQEIFRPTFERIWRTVILPFDEMKIQDIEIVFLHGMLLWSPLNAIHVEEKTSSLLKERREWFTSRLNEYYLGAGMTIMEAGLRMGQIIMILAEVEVICNQHCHDFQVCKLFEFCDMSRYWYEQLCYSKINTMPLSYADECREEESRKDQERKKEEMIHFSECNDKKEIKNEKLFAEISPENLQKKANEKWKKASLEKAAFTSTESTSTSVDENRAGNRESLRKLAKLVTSTENTRSEFSNLSPPDHSIHEFNKFEENSNSSSKNVMSSSPPELDASERALFTYNRVSGPGFSEVGRSQKMVDITEMYYQVEGSNDFLVPFHEIEPPTSLHASPEDGREEVFGMVTPPPLPHETLAPIPTRPPSNQFTNRFATQWI